MIHLRFFKSQYYLDFARQQLSMFTLLSKIALRAVLQKRHVAMFAASWLLYCIFYNSTKRLHIQRKIKSCISFYSYIFSYIICLRRLISFKKIVLRFFFGIKWNKIMISGRCREASKLIQIFKKETVFKSNFKNSNAHL